jgi:hypothetical protein
VSTDSVPRRTGGDKLNIKASGVAIHSKVMTEAQRLEIESVLKTAIIGGVRSKDQG